jgi:putative ABC transport system substrate-binding protein
MKRRDVWAATAILATLSQESAVAAAARPLRLGVLSSTDDPLDTRPGSAFLDELARHGYVPGRNLAIERRSSQRDGLDAAASALAALKVDLIYAIDGTAAALAAKRATSSIPIVFRSANPVAFGLVASLARPGGNLTGISIQGPAITTKELEAMAEALGSLRSLAYVHPPDSPSYPWHQNFVTAATAAAKALGVRIEYHAASGLAAYEPLIHELARRKVDAAQLMPGTPAFTLTLAEYEQVGSLFVRHRLPAIGPPGLGFLLSIEIAEDLMSRRLAYLVSRIAGGTKPADLPVEEFSSLRLILNAKVARALGLTLPRSLLVRADEVIA